MGTKVKVGLAVAAAMVLLIVAAGIVGKVPNAKRWLGRPGGDVAGPSTSRRRHTPPPGCGAGPASAPPAAARCC